MKERIAIVCEQEFLHHHVGVRNYIFSLSRLLENDADVDFVSFEFNAVGTLQWHRLVPAKPEQLWMSSIVPGSEISGSPREILKQFNAFCKESSDPPAPEFYRTEIGSDLGVEDYDLVILSNPWLVQFDQRIPAKRMAGIVYDLVPNSYVFTQKKKPLEFAAQHCRGFRYFREHCDCVFAISEEVASNFQEAFRMVPHSVYGLPPLLPASYHQLDPVNNERSRSIVLAGPFDLRKGMQIMPEILNTAAHSMDELLIYGKLRCNPKQAKEFFQRLELPKIRWFKDAPASTVHKLFSNAKALLFPSFDEGLGLPILEAQSLGCRVMVRDKRPMSDLVGPGARFVTGDGAADGEQLARMVHESFDHKGLQDWMNLTFSPQFVTDTIRQAIFAEPAEFASMRPHFKSISRNNSESPFPSRVSS